MVYSRKQRMAARHVKHTQTDTNTDTHLHETLICAPSVRYAYPLYQQMAGYMAAHILAQECQWKENCVIALCLDKTGAFAQPALHV